jgi:hypothetical protein
MVQPYRFVAKHIEVPQPHVYAVTAKVRRYQAAGTWYFATIPWKTSRAIKRRYGLFARGWSSLPVSVLLGGTSWTTSIFLEKVGTYLLPLKAGVRKREHIRGGERVCFRLTVDRISSRADKTGRKRPVVL